MTSRRLLAALRLSTAVGALLPFAARANPQGGQVSGGSATITQTNATRVDVNQSSNRAVIDWRSFSIAPGEQTNFQQPSATAIILNRVNGGDPSQILGKLTANGQIVLVNPSGILIGAGAHVDVNGLIATTSNITNANFMAGQMTFDQPSNSPSATVINQGHISVKEGGLVALVAPGVVNSGVINARLGKVSLVSANSFTVDLYGDRLISIAVDDAVARKMLGPDGQPLAAAVENSGRIVADGGIVQLSAKAAKGLVDNVINMSGVIQARTVKQTAGEIVLDGGPSGIVDVAGTIAATGAKPGQVGGQVTVLGEDIGLLAGAKLDASGTAGGGQVLVGGDQQGKGPLSNATAVYVDQKATIAANATDRGNGGKVVVWSDSYTRFDGTISARGGPNGGDGGSVETSSKNILTANGSVDAAAPKGRAGTWLLDPFDVTITNATSNGSFNGGTPDIFTPSASGSTVSAATIDAELNAGTSVTIQTNTVGPPGTGSVTVAAPIDLSSGPGATLSLIATGTGANVTIASSITNSGGGPLNLSLIADNVVVNNTVSIAGNLFVTNGFSIMQTAPLIVGGTTSIFASSGPIVLTNSSNALSGAITLTTPGTSAIQLTNSVATTLRDVSTGGNLTLVSGGAISQTGPVSVGGSATVSVTNPNSDIQLAVASPVTIVGNLANIRDLSLTTSNAAATVPSLSGMTNLRNLNLEFDGTGLALGPFTATGNVSVLVNGPLTQAGAATVAGTSSFGAGILTSGFSIALTQAGNSFSGAVTLLNPNGTDAQLTNSIATVLGFSFVGANLSVTSGGTISQNGALRVGGTTTLSVTAPSSDILLANTMNNFSGPIVVGGAQSNVRDFSLAYLTGPASAAALSGLTNLRNLSLENDGAGVSLGNFNASGNVTVTAHGSIVQTSAATIAGTGAFSAGANSITLNQSGNAFGGAISLSNDGANDIQVTNAIATIFGTSTVGGMLTITSNGALTQNGALVVVGRSNFSVGANAITLTQAGNAFAGTISMSNSGANDVQLINSTATNLGPSTIGRNLAVTSNGVLSQSGALVVAGTSNFSTGANAIGLTNVNNQLIGAVTLSNGGGAAASLTNATLLNLGASAVGGDLTLQADGLTGAGTVMLAGNLTLMPLNAGTDMRLGGLGSFAGLDVNNAQLGRFSGFTTLTLGAANGTGRISVAAPETFAPNVSLVLQSGGSVHVDNALTLAGSGALTLTGGALVDISATIQTASGSVTVNGPATLDPPITTSGGAVTFNGALTLTATATLTTNAGGAAGGTITFAGPLSGAGQSLTLAAGSGDILFGGTVGADAALGSIVISSTRDLTAKAAVTVGNFTQSAGSGTTDFQNGGLTVGTGSFTANNVRGTYSAGSLTINSNATVAFGTVGGVGGPAAAALIHSTGSALNQDFNGAPFGAGGLSGTTATALFVQVGSNSALEILRADQAVLTLSSLDPANRQINLENELPQGDVGGSPGGTFGSGSDTDGQKPANSP